MTSLHERRARTFWLSLILVFFAGQAVLWGYALRAVVSDPSHAEVRNPAGTERAGAAPGWRAQLSADHEQLALRLTDGQGAPVDAAVTGVAFHKARAADVHELTFTRVQPGLLIAQLDMQRAGHWRVRLVATAGRDVFIDVQDFTVGKVARR